MLAHWFAIVDCESCEDIYGGKEFCPCKMCQPEIHRFNVDTIRLYQSCSDQYIVGPSGVLGLNDIAINNAMDRYFEVDKSDRLPLSLAVRNFFMKVMKYKKENEPGVKK